MLNFSDLSFSVKNSLKTESLKDLKTLILAIPEFSSLSHQPPNPPPVLLNLLFP